MLNFPKIGNAPEPKPGRKMSLDEYIEFCAICLKGNSRITPENCLQRGEGIRQPFSCKGKMICRNPSSGLEGANATGPRETSGMLYGVKRPVPIADLSAVARRAKEEGDRFEI